MEGEISESYRRAFEVVGGRYWTYRDLGRIFLFVFSGAFLIVFASFLLLIPGSITIERLFGRGGFGDWLAITYILTHIYIHISDTVSSDIFWINCVYWYGVI